MLYQVSDESIAALVAKATITIEAEQDQSDFRGHFQSDDADSDRSLEVEINARLERGDVWAWADVRVHATVNGVVGKSDWLGGCSYESEKDFREPGGYFTDMEGEAREDLKRQLTELANTLSAAAV